MIGRNELFESERHNEPVAGWHGWDLACAELDYAKFQLSIEFASKERPIRFSKRAVTLNRGLWDRDLRERSTRDDQDAT
jgi:hypothetical protein